MLHWYEEVVCIGFIYVCDELARGLGIYTIFRHIVVFIWVNQILSNYYVNFSIIFEQ